MNTNIHIRRNRNIALMRLRDKTDASFKNIFIEHFWPIESWPDHIVNSFIDFKYTDRICICNFFLGNGLQLEYAFGAISFYHSWNETTKKHYKYTFEQLWLRIENAVKRVHHNWNHIVSSYYFYSMISRSVMYFDGHIRMHGKKINVVNNVNMSECIPIPHSIKNAREPSTEIETTKNSEYRSHEDRAKRIERRWRFLASLDNDPLVIDGIMFKFDRALYSNTLH